jgi:hypothetical protein
MRQLTETVWELSTYYERPQLARVCHYHKRQVTQEVFPRHELLTPTSNISATSELPSNANMDTTQTSLRQPSLLNSILPLAL